MQIIINNAILHIIKNQGGKSLLSREELDIDSETCHEFIQKHVKKLMKNPSSKEATFSAQSPVYALVQSLQRGDIYFKEFSNQICERLAEVINGNDEIPLADMLVVAFETSGRAPKGEVGASGDNRYIAILKLNYKECFTRKTKLDEAGADNQLVKCTTVLPFETGRVEEACLIPYDPMVLKIIEKPYSVNGEQVDYFSQIFLECETSISKKEAAEIIHMVSQEIGLQHFENDIETAAMVKVALVEESQNDGTICLENVAKRVFGENDEVAKEFVALAKDAGLPYEVQLGESFTKQQFQTHRFKADNGIEIKFPAVLSQDSGSMQITANEDGTVSITLKNLREMPV